MSIVDRLVSQLAPHDCLGCGAEGHLLCDACAGQLRPAATGCYRCRTAGADFATCLDCRDSSGLWQVRAAVVYERLAKDLVWRLKFAHAQAAARQMAALMRPLLLAHHDSTAGQPLLSVRQPSSAGFLIVPVPTATTRARQRGYDQARLLARELARSVRRPYADSYAYTDRSVYIADGAHIAYSPSPIYADVLARQGQAHQVGAAREQRHQQLAGAFRVTKPRRIAGARILLIDDVVTTGATLEAAAVTLRAAGAHHVEALVFAQPTFLKQ
jgi:predicted amidophosphoribosyltransferase